MSEIKKFFYNLSLRCAKENDLSDVTWAVCQTSEKFKLLFLNFFFPTVNFDKINSFDRELTKDDSRADFVINNDGQTFVIECKIGDTNHHFEPYLRDYNIQKSNLGYIVNYYLQKEGFEVKTWRQFYDFIENNIPENEEEKAFFEGYLKYLASVCGIIKINKKMELKSMYSLYCFNVILKSVINNRNTDKFSLSYYNKDFQENYFGYKFEVTTKNKKPNIWLNVGVWYDRENPVVTCGVWKNEGWGKPYFDELKNKESLEQFAKKNYFAKKPYEENNSFYFEGSEQFYKDFENAENVDQQKDLLCKFIDEVVDFYISN